MKHYEQAAMKKFNDQISELKGIDLETKERLISNFGEIVNYFDNKYRYLIDIIWESFELDFLPTIVRGAKDNAEEVGKWSKGKSPMEFFTDENMIYIEIIERLIYQLKDRLDEVFDKEFYEELERVMHLVIDDTVSEDYLANEEESK